MSVFSTKTHRQVREWWRRSHVAALVDAVLPPACALCGGGDLVVGSPLCVRCGDWVDESAARAYCPRCGKSLVPFGESVPVCDGCERMRFAFDSVTRVGAYTGGLRALLTAFKFKGREELDAYFVERLARVIARLAVYDDLDALVAVPTCWRHRLVRAFHPATAMAKPLARRSGIPLAPLLVRSGGPHQIGLSFTARHANVRGRFRMARGCSAPGAKILLLDDVMTTGATANECARVLKKAGADEVHVAIIARAGDDPVTLRHI